MYITNGHLSSMAAYKCTTLHTQNAKYISLLYILLSNSIKIFKEVRSGRGKGIKGLEKKFFGISKTFEVYLRPAL